MLENDQKSRPIIVKAKDLGKAIRTLAKVSGKVDSLCCTFMTMNNNLYMSMPGAELSIPCRGSWPQTVLISGKFLKPLTTFIKEKGAIKLSYDYERVFFNNFSVPCTLNNEGLAIETTVNMTLLEKYALGLKYNHDQLVRAGLEDDYMKAKEKIDGLLDKASTMLKPLNISRIDLETLLIERAEEISFGKPLV